MAEKKRVRIYSTPSCSYCHAAMDFLREKKVDFEEVDISSNSQAADEMVELSGQMGVPVIVVDNKTVIVGFDREALEKALNLKD